MLWSHTVLNKKTVSKSYINKRIIIATLENSCQTALMHNTWSITDMFLVVWWNLICFKPFMLDYNITTLYTKKTLNIIPSVLSLSCVLPFNTLPHFHLKMVGLYHNILIIDYKVCSMLSIRNELTLQNDVQHTM